MVESEHSKTILEYSVFKDSLAVSLGIFLILLVEPAVAAALFLTVIPGRMET
jgi:hypothetical protein